ncbi:MAG: GGDEF domain-containing protein [Alphaproteobacteria bacterium]
MLLGYRSDDAVLTICQNNGTKSIEINDVNENAQKLLGYVDTELKGKPLIKILPKRIADMLEDYVEFAIDANDVGSVLSKVQSFSVVDKEEKEHGFRLKVVRAESDGKNMNFKLVLQDRMGLRKNEALRQAIQENFKGHEVLDPDMMLPNRYSLEKDIELMGYYNSKSDLRTCFAVLQLDHYNDMLTQYGHNLCMGLVRHMATICRQNLRPDDVVGCVSPHRIGILLLDTVPESARMVFNRLRWQIASNPYDLPNGNTLGLSVSIGFARVTGVIKDRNLINECCGMLDMQDKNSANALLEAFVS